MERLAELIVWVFLGYLFGIFTGIILYQLKRETKASVEKCEQCDGTGKNVVTTIHPTRGVEHVPSKMDRGGDPVT